MRLCVRPWLWVCLLTSSRLFAQNSCEWKTWAEFGQTLAERSPDIEVLKNEESYRNSLSDSAALTPASVLNGQYTAGAAPWKDSHLEVSYLWTLEDQDKRNLRLAASKADVESVQQEIENRRAYQILKLALVQQSLRRMDARREVLQETAATYAKLIGQFERRVLGPEQEASLAVYRIAKKENALKIEALEVERSQITFQLAALAGCSPITLPKLKKVPQTLDRPAGKGSSPSPNMRALEAQKKSLELQADPRGFSTDLSIGPIVIADQEDDKSNFEIGVVASIPIGGERNRVLGGSKSAELKARRSALDLAITRQSIERDAWLDQYQKSMKAMEGGFSKDEAHQMHKRLETLFQGERVGAELVIEAHRQLLEHVTTYSELEAKAAEALWNIRYLDGQLKWSDL